MINKKAALLSVGIGLFCAFSMMPANINTSYAEVKEGYEISDAYWDDSNNKLVAKWEKAEKNTSYKLKLIKNGKKASSNITTKGTSYNFTKNVMEKGTGSYKFEVYSVGGGTESLIESDIYDMDSDTLYYLKQANKSTNTNNTSNNTNTTGNPAGPGLTNQTQPVVDNQIMLLTTYDASYDIPPAGNVVNMKLAPGQIPNLANQPVGWNIVNNKWYFKHADGNLVINDWLLLDNKWYLFDNSGCMITGWIMHNNIIYNFTQGGVMRANTVFEGHTFNADGAAIN